MEQKIKETPEYDFVTDDGFGHKFWVIRDENMISRITQDFSNITHLYIADGHHRSAAAALVGKEIADANPKHTGEEEYNFFLAVCFPASHLNVIDYNRVVRDLNGLTGSEFLERLNRNFIIETKGHQEYRPNALHNFALYMGGQWYSLIMIMIR